MSDQLEIAQTRKVLMAIKSRVDDHPELAEPLDWKAVERIARREGLDIMCVPMASKARLVGFGGRWTILLDSSQPRWHTWYAAHELAHYWMHVQDSPTGQYEACYHLTSLENQDDPAELEAELLADCLMGGPKLWAMLEERGKPVRRRLVGRAARRARKNPLAFVPRVEPAGSFNIGIVGESFRRRELESICGKRRPEGYEVDVTALLICERFNAYDPMAVRVEVNKKTVGYLSRRDARRYRRKYGEITRAASGHITGGWNRGGGLTGYFGVRLDLNLEEGTP
jgi:hypothetical protein